MIKTIPVFADWESKRYTPSEMYWRLQDIKDLLWHGQAIATLPNNASVLTAEERQVVSHIADAITQIQDAIKVLNYEPAKGEIVRRVAGKQGQTVEVSQLRRDPITEETYIVENKPDDKAGCTGLNPHLTRRPNWEEELRAKLADAITVDIAPEVQQIFDDAFNPYIAAGTGKSEVLNDGGLDPSDIAGYIREKGKNDVIQKGYLVMRDALDELTQRVQDIIVELDELEPDPDVTNSPHMLAMLKSIVSNQSPEYVLKMLATAYAEAAMDEVLEGGEIALSGNQKLYRAAFWAVERSKAEYKRTLKENYEEI